MLVLIVVVVVAAGALATSITQFAASIPDIRTNLPTIVAPWQQWLNSIGLGQIDLLAQAEAALANLDDIAAALIEPLQEIAVASLSVVGTMLIVFFLSIYMVLDRDDILAFLFRIVPPSYSEEARLLETSVSRSFGGFLRGQALMGAIYFLVALATNLVLGLPLAALTSTLAGLLQMIPFFGPFISWAPPVIVALVLQPESALPALILMGAGWLVVMNVLQPRIMQGAVGIHPIVVLGSVLIGGRIAGHPRRDLRDPDRRRRVGLPARVPAQDLGRPDGRRPGGAPPRGARRATGPHPARTDPRQRDRHRGAGARRRDRSRPSRRRDPDEQGSPTTTPP